jgi:hypothetical protein
MSDLEDKYLLVPKDWLLEIKESNLKILQLLQGKKNGDRSIGDFISEDDAKKLLQRGTTWFWNMRSSGQLPYSKVGGTNYYSKKDINDLIEKNRK